jgi:uncharacterized protein (DUF488 family)
MPHSRPPEQCLRTIGHGARTLDELVAVLDEAGVVLLADVRRFPGSRRHPQFSQQSLAEALPARGVAYEWWGDALGGRRSGKVPSRHVAWRNKAFRAYADHMETVEFRHALDSLLMRAAAAATAVMCAETLWWNCHRRLIADAATVRGFEVVHLGAGKPQVHRVEPSLRVEGDGDLVYDAGQITAL